MLAQAIHSSDNHPAAFPVSYGSYLFKPRTVRMQGYQDSADEHASSWHSQAADVGQVHQYGQPSGEKPSPQRLKIEAPDHNSQYGADFQSMGRFFSGRQPEYADPSKHLSRAAGPGNNLRLSTSGARYFPESAASVADFSDSDYASPTGGAIPHSGSSGMPVDAYGSRLGDLPTSAKMKAEDELDDDGLLEDDEMTAEQSAADQLASKRKMKRFRLTHQQTRYLMSEFAKQPHPDAALRNRLSSQIPGLSPRQVQVWFQNRRAKIKRLNVDDRERMLQMRTVPEGFDNVRALHSPYGALHGTQEPSPTSAARSYPHAAGFSQPSMMAQSPYGHDNTSMPGSASRHFSNDASGEKAHGPSSTADANFTPNGMGTPTYTFSQYQESSAAHTGNSAPMHEAVSYYDPNQSSMGGDASWKPTAGGESTVPDHASAKEQVATAAQPDQAHLRARYDAAQHSLVSPHRGPVLQENAFQGNWNVHSPYMAQDPRDPFGFGFNTVPQTNPAADSKGTAPQYYQYSHGMPAVTEGMFSDPQMMYAHRGADMGAAGPANPGDTSSGRSVENGGYQGPSSDHGRHDESFPGTENLDKKSGQ